MKKVFLHPGLFIKSVLCDKAALTITEAAMLLRVDRTTLSRFLNGHTAMTPELACRFSLLLGVPSRKIYELQMEYDLWMIERRRTKFHIKPLGKGFGMRSSYWTAPQRRIFHRKAA